MTDIYIVELEKAYDDVQMYQSLLDASKKRVNELAELVYNEGITVLSDGKRLSKVVRPNKKVDVLMLRTMNPEVYKAIMDKGEVTISPKILEKYDVCEQCIIAGEDTTFYTIKTKKS